MYAIESHAMDLQQQTKYFRPLFQPYITYPGSTLIPSPFRAELALASRLPKLGSEVSDQQI